MDPPATPFAGAFPVALAAIVLASSAAGSAVFQLVEAVAPEVGQAYPAARRHLVVLPGLLLPRPGSRQEVAAAPALLLLRRVYSSLSE